MKRMRNASANVASIKVVPMYIRAPSPTEGEKSFYEEARKSGKVQVLNRKSSSWIPGLLIKNLPKHSRRRIDNRYIIDAGFSGCKGTRNPACHEFARSAK